MNPKARYLDLLRQYRAAQTQTQEDFILDEMDDCWWTMSEEERTEIEQLSTIVTGDK